jgi:hypothetical protein
MAKINAGTAALARRLIGNHGMSITRATALAKAATISDTPTSRQIDLAAKRILAKAKRSDFVPGYAPVQRKSFPTPAWAKEIHRRS